tara:strand:+ start:460 stop:1365 length:906 start_codon:yes stop_codon:yes gene_type:complete
MKQVIFAIALLAMASLTGCLTDDDSSVDDNTDTINDSTSDTTEDTKDDEQIEPVGENNLTSLEKRINDLELEVDQLKKSLAEVQENLDNKLNNDGTVNSIPLARIDYPETNTALTCIDDSIELIGTGYDSDGIVWSYEWASDIDGVLSEKANVSISALTTGNHTITFRTQDDNGAWSEAGNINIEFKNNICASLSMMTEKDGSGKWTITIVKANPAISLDKIEWFFNDDDLLIASGLISELTSENYNDEGDNGMLSSGDKFYLKAGEGVLSDYSSSINGHSFELKYVPTGESLGYEITLAS